MVRVCNNCSRCACPFKQATGASCLSRGARAVADRSCVPRTLFIAVLGLLRCGLRVLMQAACTSFANPSEHALLFIIHTSLCDAQSPSAISMDVGRLSAAAATPCRPLPPPPPAPPRRSCCSAKRLLQHHRWLEPVASTSCSAAAPEVPQSLHVRLGQRLERQLSGLTASTSSGDAAQKQLRLEPGGRGEGESHGTGPAVPRHVAVIMDGNHRWALAQGRDWQYGHGQGVEALKRTIKLCSEAGVQALTVRAQAGACGPHAWLWA